MMGSSTRWTAGKERELATLRTEVARLQAFHDRFVAVMLNAAEVQVGRPYDLGVPEDDREQSTLFAAVDDYLGRLSSDTRRLQAVHNLMIRLRRRGCDMEAASRTPA